jgi:hypothetical protein
MIPMTPVNLVLLSATLWSCFKCALAEAQPAGTAAAAESTITPAPVVDVGDWARASSISVPLWGQCEYYVYILGFAKLVVPDERTITYCRLVTSLKVV